MVFELQNLQWALNDKELFLRISKLLDGEFEYLKKIDDLLGSLRKLQVKGIQTKFHESRNDR
jgi:hypothetical protein